MYQSNPVPVCSVVLNSTFCNREYNSKNAHLFNFAIKMSLFYHFFIKKETERL